MMRIGDHWRFGDHRFTWLACDQEFWGQGVGTHTRTWRLHRQRCAAGRPGCCIVLGRNATGKYATSYWGNNSVRGTTENHYADADLSVTRFTHASRALQGLGDRRPHRPPQLQPIQHRRRAGQGPALDRGRGRRVHVIEPRSDRWITPLLGPAPTQ